MAAPYGNRNAEKWSFKKAISLFNDAIELSNKKETITITKGSEIRVVEGYKFDFIGEIARELGTFHMIFNHLVKRFPLLQRKHFQFLNNLEQNCYYNTKKGIIKEGTGLVNLKSNHKWSDRFEIDNKSSDGSMSPNKEIDLSKLTDKELIEYKKLQSKLENE